MPSAAEIQAYLSANPGMSDADIAAAMNQYGVSTADMAAATGSNLADIQSRYDAVTPAAVETDYFEQQFAPDVFAPVYTPPAAVETLAPVYTPPSGGKIDLEPADEPTPPPVAPVAPTGIATLAPESQLETPTGVAALVPPAAPVTPAKPTDQEIVKFLTDNPTVSDADIAKIINSTGLKPEDIARATNSKVEDVTTRYEAVTPTAPVETPPAASVTTTKPPEVTPPTDTAAATETLKKQILSQNTTNKWKGEGLGSAEANAADMAKIMASIGITDIKDFGKVTKTVDAAVTPKYDQTVVGIDSEGNQILSGKIIGYTDQNGNEVDPKLVKVDTVYGGGDSGTSETVYTAPVGKQEVFGNKKTGQEVPNTYSERQTGNFFGGTFAGKGNTGYGVQFDKEGNPIFYTAGASSNDLANLMADLGPIGQIGLAIATGGLSIPQQIAANMAMQLLSGTELKDVVKGAATSYLTSQIPGSDLMKDGASFIKDLGLSPEITSTLTKGLQNAASSTVGAVISGQDAGEAFLKGFTTGGINGAVNSLANNIQGFSDLTPAQKSMVTNVVTGVVSNKPLDQLVINTAINAATAAVADANKTKSTDVVDTLKNAGLTDGTSTSNLATKDIISSITGGGTTTKIDNDITSILTGAGLTQNDEFSGVNEAIAATAKANNTSIGNTEADTLEEATALAKSRNPTGTQFTYGGKTSAGRPP